MRVNGIFTATTISPSLSSRQCSDRYTIRAGRNLPDKEFRYLRTVIVTAAIHQGLNSELRTKVLTPPFDLLALGRHHTIYFDLPSLHSAVFLINSRLSHFSAAAGCSWSKSNHNQRLPFSRSYGDNLPSSLTRVLSSALEYSSHLPVSVLVRSPSTARAYFLEALRYTIGSPEGYPLAMTWNPAGGFASQPSSSSHGHVQSSACLTYSVSPLPLS